MDYRRKRTTDNNEDSPTYSRLFIICEKNLTEDDFTEAFSKYGSIQDIWLPRDHNTGEPKGVAYIKFSKTSEAAVALENMNNAIINNSSRPLKVLVASNRADVKSDDYDDDKYKRLFVTVSKTRKEDELKEYFTQFGNVENVNIQRDRNTGESRGFAYISFLKFSEAACAFENCEKSYRAVFANPRGHNRRPETAYESNINSLAMTTSNMKTSLVSMMNTHPKGYNQIIFMCCPYLSHSNIKKLFDIVPGMVNFSFYVDLVGNFGKGRVQYSNPISAAYAVEKLHKFEYPPGLKIFVKPDNSSFDAHEQNFPNIPNVMNNLKKAIASTSNSNAPDLAQIAEAVAEASKLIKMVTADVADNIPDSNNLHYCSVKLPPTQPLADIDSEIRKRCFLVCKPQPPPLTVLRDIFCRFGNLIDVYTLPNKTVGYARYATVEAADNAIKTLHGAEVCGIRMKVIEADERRDDDSEGSSKKMRYN